MSSTPDTPAFGARQPTRLGTQVLLALALVSATLAGCGGDGGSGGRPAAGRSSSTALASAPLTAAGATPLTGGELIVFERLVAGGEKRDLYVIGRDGGEPALLRSPGEYAHWSPDGRRLAFSDCLNPPDCTTAIALIDRSTGNVGGFPGPDPTLEIGCAVWAPSGNELACEGGSEKDPTRNGVYAIRSSDGQGLTRITKNPGGTDSPLAYSPDGTQLLINRTDPSRRQSALFVAPVGSGRPHRITPWGFEDDYAGWSPDGRTIVFGTNGSLYRVSAQGRELAKISLTLPDGSPAENAFDVAFSPDGHKIAFSLGSPAPGIYQARPDGSDVERLTSGQDHHANWSADPGT